MRPVGVFLAAAALLAFSTALSQTVPPDDSQPRIGRKPTIELDIPAGNQIHDMYDTSRLDAIGRIRLEIKVSVAARKLRARLKAQFGNNIPEEVKAREAAIFNEWIRTHLIPDTEEQRAFAQPQEKIDLEKLTPEELEQLLSRAMVALANVVRQSKTSVVPGRRAEAKRRIAEHEADVKEVQEALERAQKRASAEGGSYEEEEGDDRTILGSVDLGQAVDGPGNAMGSVIPQLKAQLSALASQLKESTASSASRMGAWGGCLEGCLPRAALSKPQIVLDTFFTCIAPRPCPHLKQWVAKTVADNRERIQRTRMDYGEAAAATLAIALILAGLQRFVPVPY